MNIIKSFIPKRALVSGNKLYRRYVKKTKFMRMYEVEFEVLTTVTMNSMVIYGEASFILERARRFGEIYSLHLQVQKVSKAIMLAFLLNLLFDPQVQAVRFSETSLSSNILHDITFQKIVLFIIITVRT
jgi:uncharacterized membrane protein